jgi:anti-sigma-K factor RskA
MNHRPELRDRLAAEYVLGTLHGRARSRFRTLLRDDAPLQARVRFWEQALTPMAAPLRAAAPSPKLWQAIEARIAPPAPFEARKPWWARWFLSFDGRTLGSLAVGVMLGLTLTLTGPSLWQQPGAQDERSSEPESQLPQSYVGVLATPEGRTGVIVSSLRHGKVMDVKQVQPVPVPDGRTLYLWAIEADGKTRPIGPVPLAKFVQVPLTQTSETLFASATELALSIEAQSAAPSSPSGPFVYRGLCGKLWRVPAAKKP